MDDTLCRLWSLTVLYYPQGTSWRVRPGTLEGMPWWRRFQALMYQGCYRTELLPSLTAEWLESSPPNIGVEGSNPRGLKFDNRKGYVGGWIYPEYSLAWLIPVVGFDSWQYCTVLYCTVLYCNVLYYTLLYCTVLYCTVLYTNVLYCTVLYCMVLLWPNLTVLHCTLNTIFASKWIYFTQISFVSPNFCTFAQKKYFVHKNQFCVKYLRKIFPKTLRCLLVEAS